MMKLFWQADTPGGQRYYRTTAPVKFLRKNVREMEIDIGDAISNFDYDAFLYHRVAQPPVFLKKKNKKIIWELDDDLWNIPDWSPAFEMYNSQETKDHLGWFLENADEIIVSTAGLAQEVRSRSKRPITILPNLIDMELWNTGGNWGSGQTTILWAGSPYHEKDIEGIVHPLQQLLRDLDNIRIIFFGDMPTSMCDFQRVRWANHGMMIPHARYRGRVEFIPFQYIEVYFQTLMSIKADICLAPLFPCEFSNKKSNIKYIESSVLGSVTVASNLPPYQNTQAILVDKQTQWYGTIRELVDNPQMRMEKSERVQQDAINNWAWQCPTADKWYNFFRDLCE